MTPRSHHCPTLPDNGIAIYFDSHSTQLRDEPTWLLNIQREATETDLEANNYLEEVGDTIWTTTLEITHCPFCGDALTYPDVVPPPNIGRFTHIDSSGWNGKHM